MGKKKEIMDIDGDETRYASLLQPLRDLASNWEVDIAESLTEYVEDLQRLQVSIDGGKSTLNFAQAALLIQGSTAVYSKKVEYLHQLVLQALELMAERKTNTDQAAHGGNAGSRTEKAKLSALEDERFLFGADPTYLMLDDFVDEARNIDLDSDMQGVKLKEKRRSSVCPPHPHHQRAPVKTPTFSQKVFSNHPTLNVQGRMPALNGDYARSSMVLMHSLMAEDHGGASLKMSSCAMNDSGALLIGGLPPLHYAPARPDEPRGGSNNLGLGTSRMDMDDYNDQPYYDDGDADNDAGYDVGAFVMPASAEAGGAAGGTTNSLPRQAKLTRVQGASSSSSAMDRSAASSSSSSNKSTSGAASSSLTLMDPHEAVPGSRAVKKGKTFRLPMALLSAPSGDKVAGSGGGSSSSSSPYSNFSSGSKIIEFLLQSGQRTSEMPKGLLHASLFAPLVRAQKKARLAEARKESKGKARGPSAAEFIYHEGAHEDSAPTHRTGADLDNEDVGGFWGDDDDDDDDGGNYHVDYDADYGVGHDNLAGPEGLSDDPNPLSEEDELHMRMERVLDEGFSQAAASTYETLCRRHIDAFMRGAEQYARCVAGSWSAPFPC